MSELGHFRLSCHSRDMSALRAISEVPERHPDASKGGGSSSPMRA